MLPIIPPRLTSRRKQRGYFTINPYAYASAGGGGGDTDPDFASVVQLAHFDGSNGSTTLTNSCARGNTLSVVSTSTISTAQSKWGGASLRCPNSSTGAQNLSSIADYGMGTGAWTAEAWIRLDSLRNYDVAFTVLGGGGATAALLYIDSTGTIRLYQDSTNRITSSGGVISAATWHFISLSRASGANGTHYMAVDGVSQGTPWSGASNYQATGELQVGCDPYGLGFVGYIDDFRVTKGVQRYDATTYSVPTAAFPNS